MCSVLSAYGLWMDCGRSVGVPSDAETMESVMSVEDNFNFLALRWTCHGFALWSVNTYKTPKQGWAEIRGNGVRPVAQFLMSITCAPHQSWVSWKEIQKDKRRGDDSAWRDSLVFMLVFCFSLSGASNFVFVYFMI